MPTSTILTVCPILCVSDMTRALVFYTLLGFQAERYRGQDDYAFLTRDGFELHLSLTEALVPGANPGNGVYFQLAPGTARALEDEFRTAGAPILSPLAPREWKRNEFVLADPDANLLRFGEPLHATDQR